MVGKWTIRLGSTALLIGGVCIGLAYFEVLPRVPSADARNISANEMNASRSKARPLELASVEVAKVEPTSMAEHLRVSGELCPVSRVAVKAKVAGTVREVNVRVGDTVKRGDVLVRFETEDLQSALVQRNSNLEAARAQLLLAKQTLQRTEQLVDRGFATRTLLEQARSDAAAALANVEGLEAHSDTARTALRDADLIAPFDGIVSDRSVEPGETASANADLLTVVDASVLEAKVLVSTRDVIRLRVGQTVELDVDGLEGHPVVGAVDRISPIANEGSRFVPVHIRLENLDRTLWAGMFATGSILVRESKDVLVLPSTSLREDETGRFVLKLADGKLVRQPVRTGTPWNGGRMIEIVEGLRRGDIVVTAPLPDLKPDTLAVVSRAG